MAKTKFGEYTVDFHNEYSVSIFFDDKRADITGGDALEFASECENALRCEFEGEIGIQEKIVAAYFAAYTEN